MVLINVPEYAKHSRFAFRKYISEHTNIPEHIADEIYNNKIRQEEERLGMNHLHRKLYIEQALMKTSDFHIRKCLEYFLECFGKMKGIPQTREAFYRYMSSQFFEPYPKAPEILIESVWTLLKEEEKLMLRKFEKSVEVKKSLEYENFLQNLWNLAKKKTLEGENDNPIIVKLLTDIQEFRNVPRDKNAFLLFIFNFMDLTKDLHLAEKVYEKISSIFYAALRKIEGKTPDIIPTSPASPAVMITANEPSTPDSPMEPARVVRSPSKTQKADNRSWLNKHYNTSSNVNMNLETASTTSDMSLSFDFGSITHSTPFRDSAQGHISPFMPYMSIESSPMTTPLPTVEIPWNLTSTQTSDVPTDPRVAESTMDTSPNATIPSISFDSTPAITAATPSLPSGSQNNDTSFYDALIFCSKFTKQDIPEAEPSHLTSFIQEGSTTALLSATNQTDASMPTEGQEKTAENDKERKDEHDALPKTTVYKNPVLRMRLGQRICKKGELTLEKIKDALIEKIGKITGRPEGIENIGGTNHAFRNTGVVMVFFNSREDLLHAWQHRDRLKDEYGWTLFPHTKNLEVIEYLNWKGDEGGEEKGLPQPAQSSKNDDVPPPVQSAPLNGSSELRHTPSLPSATFYGKIVNFSSEHHEAGPCLTGRQIDSIPTSPVKQEPVDAQENDKIVDTPYGNFKKMPKPQIENFKLDLKLGYWLDTSTGYYHDKNSNYFYDIKSERWMFYSNFYGCYIPVKGGDEEAKKRLILWEKLREEKEHSLGIRIKKEVKKEAEETSEVEIITLD